MLAPDGRCKTLDASADGYGRAEAVGVMLLQPLAAVASAAAAPLALLAGSAVNQDGRSSALTAPNGPAQQDAVRAALADAGLGAADVGAVGMHGTGTSLGDPIEVGALAAALGGAGSRPLLLASSKSWLGHAEPAAGVVGVLQAVQQLGSRQAAPICHLRALNPLVASALDSARGWSLPRQPAGVAAAEAVAVARCGVSAFAFQVGSAGHDGLCFS
jgi:acyl transferase domain-containing protein